MCNLLGSTEQDDDGWYLGTIVTLGVAVKLHAVKTQSTNQNTSK